MPCIAWVILTVFLVICHEEDKLEEGLMAMETNQKRTTFDVIDAYNVTAMNGSHLSALT